MTEPRRALVAGRSYRVAASYKPMKKRGKCAHCGRWVWTFKRSEENQLRARGHKAWLPDYERYPDGTVTAKLACPGAGERVTP